MQKSTYEGDIDHEPIESDWFTLGLDGETSEQWQDVNPHSQQSDLMADASMRQAISSDAFKQTSGTDDPSSSANLQYPNARNPRRHCLSPYAAHLIDQGISLKPLNKIYQEAANIDRHDAYRRIRSKLTPDLKQKLESGDPIQIQQAIDELCRLKPTDKLNLSDMRLLKSRMAPYLASRRVKGRNVTSSGMRRFPQEHVRDLLYGEGEVFKEAADLLYECYLAEDNEKRKKGREPKEN